MTMSCRTQLGGSSAPLASNFTAASLPIRARFSYHSTKSCCRDYCGYCIVSTRSWSARCAHTMAPQEVMAVAREGEKLGCTEALFSLGDKPEAQFPEMRESLKALGYDSTMQYCGSYVCWY